MTRQTVPDGYGRQSDQDGSHHLEDAAPDGCDALPSYESLEDPPPAAAPTSLNPTGDSKGSDRASVHPGHRRPFREYYNHYDQGFEMNMAPTPEVLAHLTSEWAAVLLVKSGDVPRLMREGFFWSAENVVPEEGYMSNETRREWTDLGLRYKRTWMLADKSDDETPRWIARLEIVSQYRHILPGFRVQNLSRGNVFTARAWNGLHQIYAWDCRWLGRYNYNCIYDDKPLQGWWPWPREEGAYVGYSALATDAACELVQERPASHWQAHKGYEPHGFDQQSSGCVIL